MFDSKMRRLGGILSLFLAITAPAMPAGPALTTIQDTLYKADGTPFTGLLYINWKSFTSADSQNIATQNVVATVVNGVLRVQLVPTTTAGSTAWYQVGYNSNGAITFTEYWAVPPSPVPVALKDVRMPVPPSSTGSVVQPPATTTIEISDVDGLSDELSARVVRGTGFQPSAAAVINSSGMLDGAIGNPYDCLHVDGSSGSCGSGSYSGPDFVDEELPAGNIDGSNTVFTLAGSPSPGSSLLLFRNGVLQKQGVDYSLSNNQITFLAGAVPSAGDVLAASYRVPGASGLGSGGSGLSGALTGSLPSPSLAAGVVTDYNIAPGAGIAESKLALNFSTHTNANDPTPEQKLAMAGTAGVVSGSNRFVTDQDPRLTDPRPPTAHPLLSASHSDTFAGTPIRGDIIVAQGPGAWTRMSLGPPNRCLMSNGADAVWNTCLFTGFATGSLPFVDSTGSLAQNNSRLFWDNTNRRFGIGISSPMSTLHVQDATPATGSTTVTVRAGQGQAANPLERWLDMNGLELGRVDGQGFITAPGFRGASSPSSAAWHDAGSVADPSAPADGDAWYSTSADARKTRDGGQTHTSPQIICASGGTSTSAAAPASLGTCTIPAGLLQAGDRVELKFDYSHDATTTGFGVQIAINQNVLFAPALPAAERFLSGTMGLSAYTGAFQWSAQGFGAATAPAFNAGALNSNPAQGIQIDFRANLASAGTESVTLRGFTVTRYPAQSNP